jgi:hypothetical protein
MTSKTKTSKTPASTNSTCEKPVALVHRIAQDMIETDPAVTRKTVVAACIEAGVNKHTAATQYQKWCRANQAK